MVLLAFVCSMTCNWAVADSTDTMEVDSDTFEYKIEIQYHKDLVASKNQPTSSLNEFTTDGCSGGLSVGWQYLAGKIEKFRDVHGDQPPWESCCVSHDRAYHEGGGRDASVDLSYRLRRRADQILMACVQGTGTGRADELSVAYGISEQEVSSLYTVIAKMMYRAVRLGGIPCSGLPWRWGYGWPECE